MSNQPETTPSKPLLWGWEIMRTFPDPKDEKRRVRATMIIAAPSIEHVWEYLALDRADTAVEIEAIHRFGPILEVLENTHQKKHSESSSVGGSN